MMVSRSAIFSRKNFFFSSGDSSSENENFIPKTINEYPSPINVLTKYQSDFDSYTFRESIAFSIRTKQKFVESVTIVAALIDEEIFFAFDIEVRCDKKNVFISFFFSFKLSFCFFRKTIE